MMRKILFDLFDFLVLCPISKTWSAVYRVRRFAYRFNFISSSRFKVPIISVGNISFGGTGKTPMTMWLSEYFEGKTLKVMVLMRGYRGGLESDHGIIYGDHRLGANPDLFGDEALLIARRLKQGCVVVGKKRAQNLQRYFPQIKPDVVILDDGHQHLKIQRNCNLVLFDALMDERMYDAPPRGYLREGLSSLCDADMALIGRADIAGQLQVEKLKRFLKQHLRDDTPIATFGYVASGLFNSKFEKVHELAEIKSKSVIAMTGIASPDSFFTSIIESGATIVEKVVFPDHHLFTFAQVQAVLKRAEENDLIIVTTEKDIVKIRRVVDSPRILFLQIVVNFIEGKEQLEMLLQQTVRTL